MMNSVGAHCVTYSSSNISQHVIIIIPLPFFLFSSYSTIDFIFDIQLCWWRTAAGRIWISPATTTTTILQSGMKRKDRLVHLIGPARIESIEPNKIGRRRLNNVRYERIGTIWAIDRRIKNKKSIKSEIVLTMLDWARTYCDDSPMACVCIPLRAGWLVLYFIRI